MARNWSAWICRDRDLGYGIFSIKGEMKEICILNMIKHNDQALGKILLCIHIAREVGICKFCFTLLWYKRRLWRIVHFSEELVWRTISLGTYSDKAGPRMQSAITLLVFMDAAPLLSLDFADLSLLKTWIWKHPSGRAAARTAKDWMQTCGFADQPM